MTKPKKTPSGGARSTVPAKLRPLARAASDGRPDPPLVLTLRDVEVPPPPAAAAAKQSNDGLVVSDSGFGPDAYSDHTRMAEAPPQPAAVEPPAETLVVSDSGFGPDAYGDSAHTAEAPPLPAALEPRAETLVASDIEARPAPYLGDPDADRAAQRAARRAQVRRERQRDAPPVEEAPPDVLVLGADPAACDPLCAQLRAFGFAVQCLSAAPPLPAPWPFVAVFVAPPVQAADGGDAIDLCHQVRESSRLPGEKKPVLVLAAPQLSATDRVRAGLAGCNEILLGAPTRGAVAQLLDARGIALPSDARR